VYMGDEDGVDQVKMEDYGVVALGKGQRVKSRRKAKASSLAEVGHASTSGVWWSRPQNHRQGLVVSSTKPSVQFTGLGLETRAEVPRRNGRHVAASGSSRRGEATGEEALWPSDEDDTGLDHNDLGLSGLTQLYPRANRRLCNSPVK
jgi:hypothetical protein